MRILWFTNTSSLYNKDVKVDIAGGWIESLESLMTSKTQFTLGVCFFSDESDLKFKVIKGNTTYYPIKLLNKKNILIRLLNNLRSDIGNEKKILPKLFDVIDDFKPDLINIFGTEKLFGLIQRTTKIPVVIHLQGILNPYLDYSLPLGHSNIDLLINRSLILKNIIGTGPYFHIRKMKKAAKRELEIISISKNFMGRTIWDHNIVKLYNENSAYFHVNEVLRNEFYNQHIIEFKKSKTLNIVSTISSSTYKGIDVIFKVSILLKYLKFDYNWTIIGIDRNDAYVKYFVMKQNFNINEFPIHFIGKKQGSNLVNILQRSDVFVHPSYIDNSPNSVCEAQILGLPVIACNVGGLETIIENNVTGYLVPINGIHEICNILIRKFNNESHINEIKKNAKTVSQYRHDKTKILEDLIKTYNTIVNNENH